MNLKNYTSNVPAHTTIAYIEQYLAECGVLNVSKDYDASRQPVSLTFEIMDGAHKFKVRLPAKVADVHKHLWKEYVTTHTRPKKTEKDFAEQAARTAWAIQRDWVQIQMTLIVLKQARPLEVFLAYVWDGKQTVFQRLDGGGMRNLLPERSEA